MATISLQDLVLKDKMIWWPPKCYVFKYLHCNDVGATKLLCGLGKTMVPIWWPPNLVHPQGLRLITIRWMAM
jgi:hypothetical protein